MHVIFMLPIKLSDYRAVELKSCRTSVHLKIECFIYMYIKLYNVVQPLQSVFIYRNTEEPQYRVIIKPMCLSPYRSGGVRRQRVGGRVHYGARGVHHQGVSGPAGDASHGVR